MIANQVYMTKDEGHDYFDEMLEGLFHLRSLGWQKRNQMGERMTEKPNSPHGSALLWHDPHFFPVHSDKNKVE